MSRPSLTRFLPFLPCTSAAHLITIPSTFEAAPSSRRNSRMGKYEGFWVCCNMSEYPQYFRQRRYSVYGSTRCFPAILWPRSASRSTRGAQSVHMSHDPDLASMSPPYPTQALLQLVLGHQTEDRSYVRTGMYVTG